MESNQSGRNLNDWQVAVKRDEKGKRGEWVRCISEENRESTSEAGKENKLVKEQRKYKRKEFEGLIAWKEKEMREV